jgi:type III pantothenate kinase
VAVAAYEHAGQGPVLAVNAGTALTFDFVDAQGRYLGGSISPGLRTRFRSLNAFTAALPMVEAEGPAPLIGDSTETSIRSGVLNGMLAEIEGLVQQYRQLAGSGLKVYLTGGDAVFLGNHLKSVTFVDANLLLYGINAIVLHHA